jgi:hypothetical protein
MENGNSRLLLIGLLALAVIMFIVGGGLLYSGLTAEEEPVVEASVEPTVDVATIVAQTVAAISQASVEPTAVAPTLAPVEDTATSGPPPTVTAEATALPTETPIPTDTPVPPTNTPVPIIPTNTPVPIIPTNTPAPPTNTPPPPGPQPGNHRGLQASHFALQDWRTNLVPNGEIWYEWTIINTSGAPVPYSTIGVLPRKDGVDRVEWYQNNWGGNSDEMPPEGLSWPSWMSVPERGNYTLRVVVCFDGFQACLNGQGTFHTLSNEIPITIN